MAKILFVHGMRMEDPHKPDKRDVEEKRRNILKILSGDLRRLLATTEWGKQNPDAIPSATDMDLVYWADLFRVKPAPDEDELKGFDFPGLRAAYYEFLRSVVRLADRLTYYDADGRPRTWVSELVDSFVYQTAVYMQNGPVYHPDPAAEDGAFYQVQARLKKHLGEDTRIVIGHSLGTVVAYEGLCWHPHRVHSFITIGSPLATPRLILDPMRRRLARLLGRDAAGPLPSANVKRWVNVFASQDVWSVPITHLAPVIDPSIKDIQVEQDHPPHRTKEVHMLPTYLKQPRVGEEIASALAEIEADDD